MMNNSKTRWFTAFTLIWATISGASAFGQDELEAAAAAPGDAAVNAATNAPGTASPALETNPSVRAALELPRNEPADYYQAIGWLIDLGRPELARPILDELGQLEMSDAQRAELVTQFGSQRMLQLAKSAELAPAGAAFADACMRAAAALANDPRRIAQLVAQLTDPSPEVRSIARNDLSALGKAGAVATLEALRGKPIPVAGLRWQPRPPKCVRSSMAHCSRCFPRTIQVCVPKWMEFCGSLA